MTLPEELARISSIFIDTAPIIYYIEAHPDFGPITLIPRRTGQLKWSEII